MPILSGLRYILERSRELDEDDDAPTSDGLAGAPAPVTMRGGAAGHFVGQHFWARGFFVNTVGRDEDAIRAYIRNQEKEGFA